jgi:hypothetical protein
VRREGGLDATDPIKRDLLPKGDVPEFLKDGVRSQADAAVCLIFRYAFKDEGWWRCRAVATEDLFEFVHSFSAGLTG